MDTTAQVILIILFVMATICAAVAVPLFIISRSIRFVGVSFKKTYKKIRHI